MEASCAKKEHPMEIAEPEKKPEQAISAEKALEMAPEKKECFKAHLREDNAGESKTRKE
jgi:hypothetical protein